jgi:hypothetical protein
VGDKALSWALVRSPAFRSSARAHADDGRRDGAREVELVGADNLACSVTPGGADLVEDGDAAGRTSDRSSAVEAAAISGSLPIVAQAPALEASTGSSARPPRRVVGEGVR